MSWACHGLHCNTLLISKIWKLGKSTEDHDTCIAMLNHAAKGNTKCLFPILQCTSFTSNTSDLATSFSQMSASNTSCKDDHVTISVGSPFDQIALSLVSLSHWHYNVIQHSNYKIASHTCWIILRAVASKARQDKEIALSWFWPFFLKETFNGENNPQKKLDWLPIKPANRRCMDWGEKHFSY